MTGSDWANYETWLVYVNMFNVESVRREFRSNLERRAKEGLDRRTVRDILIHDVQSFVEEAAEGASRRVRDPIMADFVGSFPGRIDCGQIADAWMDVYDELSVGSPRPSASRRGTAPASKTKKAPKGRTQRSRRSKGGDFEHGFQG